MRLDRTNTAFHDLYRLAKLFLSGDWQRTTGGDSKGFALLFPMNELFEKFIGRSLERALGSRTVRLQPTGRHALTSTYGVRAGADVEWRPRYRTPCPGSGNAARSMTEFTRNRSEIEPATTTPASKAKGEPL